MAYQDVVAMASSQSLLARVTAAAAEQGRADPLQWAQANIWALASSPGWDDSWAYAESTSTDDHNPDTGARPGVVTDAMILSAVQGLLTEQGTP